MENNQDPIPLWNIERLVVALKAAETPEAANDYFIEIIRRFDKLMHREHKGIKDLVDFDDFRQEVLTVVFRGLPKLEIPAAFAGYFDRIARRVAIEIRAGRLKHPTQSLDDLEDYDPPAPTPEQDALLMAAFLQAEPLTEIERQVLTYLFVEDLDPKEIAPLLKITEGSVRAYKSRALEKLREIYR